MLKMRSRRLNRALAWAVPVAVGALLVAAIAVGGHAPARRARGATLSVGAPTRPPTLPVSAANATGATLTAAQWRSRATAICDAVTVPPIATSSMQAAAPGFQAASYALARLADQLGGLRPPAALRAQVATMLGLLDQESRLAGEASAAAATADSTGLQSQLGQLAGLEPRDAAVWPRLGMAPCK